MGKITQKSGKKALKTIKEDDEFDSEEEEEEEEEEEDEEEDVEEEEDEDIDEEEGDEEEDEEEEEEDEEEEVEEDFAAEDEEDLDPDDAENAKGSSEVEILNVGCEEYDIDSISIRVPDSERITRPEMTKYELARVIGTRVQQLIKSAPPLVSNTVGKPPIQIALDELLTGKIPFKIKRPMPYPKHEIWKVKELKVNLSEDEIEDLIKTINV